MERFGFAGLWQHIGTTVVAALFPIADAVVSYLNAIVLPSWAHALVGVAAAVLAFYKGKTQPALKPAP